VRRPGRESAPLPRRYRADRRYRHARRSGLAAQGLELVGRDRGDDLEVVAAGQDDVDQRRLGSKRVARRRRQRHARDCDVGGDPGHAAQLGEIARKAVGHVDGGAGVAAQRSAMAVRG